MPEPIASAVIGRLNQNAEQDSDVVIAIGPGPARFIEGRHSAKITLTVTSACYTQLFIGGIRSVIDGGRMAVFRVQSQNTVDIPDCVIDASKFRSENDNITVLIVTDPQNGGSPVDGPSVTPVELVDPYS